jgi:AmmeMemoRadiSam system protein A
MTESAASRDPRVSPITSTELPDIHIDISVISPLQAVYNPVALQIGKHGLHIAGGEKRGVLLPQVAAQYDWDVEMFLTQTCLKAGLAREAWKQPGTEVSSFTALVIREER